MSYFNHLESDTISKFREANFMYCINADDTNKIADRDMFENFEYLVIEHKFTLAEISKSIFASIDASLCADELKEKMKTKWKQEFESVL